jgi:hypothetical protein
MELYFIKEGEVTDKILCIFLDDGQAHLQDDTIAHLFLPEYYLHFVYFFMYVPTRIVFLLEGHRDLNSEVLTMISPRPIYNLILRSIN